MSAFQFDPIARLEEALIARGRSRRDLHDLLRRLGASPSPEDIDEVKRRVLAVEMAEAEVQRLARAFAA